jgi:DNA-binding transcriptional MocR family regulator
VVEWKRHEIVARQSMARRLLRDARYHTAPSSPHVWLALPAQWSADTFAAQVRARGVLLNPSSEFAVGDHPPRAVRLCLGTPRTRAGLEQALTIVADTLADSAPAARAVV